MHAPTRFGDFLLFKRLSEDPLGETYRAGRIAAATVSEHVFLRTYSVPGADSAELARELGATRHKIRAPAMAYPAQSGEVGGVAYAVYEYTTGWDVSQFIATSSSGFSEAERDHGLLVAERLARGLAVVHQTDPALARPFHGFLVPYNVRLSGDGEILLMGSEAGPYLARLAARGQVGEIHAYLSPEVRSGQPPTASDDVYSLGALLWTLLLGQAPPLDAAAGLTTSLASARMVDGEMLPAGLAEILQSSLATPRARAAHAGLWHNQLTEWMTRNKVETTHFDLAFFVHELFRRQMQKEQEEIEKEKQLDLTPKTPQAVAPQTVAPQTVAPQTVAPQTAPQTAAPQTATPQTATPQTATPQTATPPAVIPEPQPPEMSDVILRPDLSGMVQRPALTPLKPEAVHDETGVVETAAAARSKVPLYAGLAVVVLAAVAIGGLMLRGGSGPPPEPPPVQAAPPPLPPPAAPSELQIAHLELERLVGEQAKAMSDQLAAEYDEHIRSLREQLKAAEEAEAETLRALAQSAPPPSPVTASPSVPVSGAAAAAPGPGPVRAADADDDVNTASDRGATPPVTPPGPTPSTAVPKPAVQASQPPVAPPPPQVAPPPPQVAPPPPQVAPPPPEVAPPPAQPAVVTPPLRIHMPEPRYPERARRQRTETTILIKVLVDTDGKVVDARPAVKKPDPDGFYQEAVRTALRGEFEPAKTDGVPTRMWTTVVITFTMKKQ